MTSIVVSSMTSKGGNKYVGVNILHVGMRFGRGGLVRAKLDML